MRVLVTGGAGFIGSHFAKRLQAAGDDVRVLDKLTYSGNPANLEGTGIELVAGDICDADAVAEAAAGCDAIVNFAAETHVDRSILGAGRVHPDERLRHAGAARGGAPHGTRASSRSRPTRSTATSPTACPRPRTTRSRPSSPYCAAKAGGDLQMLGVRSGRTASTRSITRGSNTYGPNQYPGEAAPADS